jgi:hypothetical protein
MLIVSQNKNYTLIFRHGLIHGLRLRPVLPSLVRRQGLEVAAAQDARRPLLGAEEVQQSLDGGRSQNGQEREQGAKS